MKNYIMTVLRVLAIACLFGIASARAVDTPFDLTTATEILTGIAVTAAALVGGLIALSGGMAAWKKLKGFFNRAS